MATHGLQRMIIRTVYSNLEWTVCSFIGQHYPSLDEFGMFSPFCNNEPDDFAFYVQKGDAKGGIAFLQKILEKNAKSEWLPDYWHVQETFTYPMGYEQKTQGKFIIETYNGRVQLIISYHHEFFWIDVRYETPTLNHIRGYTEYIGEQDMLVWCEVVNPDGTERGLYLDQLPVLVNFWNGEGKCPLPKQYPFVGMGI